MGGGADAGTVWGPLPLRKMNEVFATSSYTHHTAAEFENLAAWGFTHVVSAQAALHSEREVELGHQYGLKMLARWPDWGAIGCLGADMAFRNYLGETNVGHSLYAGPSLWCAEADERALHALNHVANDGWDGVVVHIIVGDRPLPTAWHLSENRHFKDLYWSFDEWARREWGQLRNGKPMPERPDEMANEEFYRWYQGAWFRRLNLFTDAAIRKGFRQIGTWYVPMNWYEPETLADATADSVPGMEQWRQNVLNDGADPLVIVSHMFGMGTAWENKCRKIMQECNGEPLNWRSIVGVECGKADSAVGNLASNGNQARQLGFCGILAADEHLKQKQGRIVW